MLQIAIECPVLRVSVQPRSGRKIGSDSSLRATFDRRRSIPQRPELRRLMGRLADIRRLPGPATLDPFRDISVERRFADAASGFENAFITESREMCHTFATWDANETNQSMFNLENWRAT